MAGVRDFPDLQIWQQARDRSKKISSVTKQEPFRFDRRLVAQINDSSDSVVLNIAEEFGGGTQGEFPQFPRFAIGSVDETRFHLAASYDHEYLTREEYGDLFALGSALPDWVLQDIDGKTRLWREAHAKEQGVAGPHTEGCRNSVHRRP